MTSEFHTMGLDPKLVQAVATLGYEAPTPIQKTAIPLLLEGHDVIGQAQTGTGKTAAFALPMLHKLPPQDPRVRALVVTPTRELAKQVARAIHEYGQFQNVRVLPVYGGQSYSRQIRRLKSGVDIVVGTPGRMLDLIRKNLLDLSEVRFLVLDEADEMLSMGFIEDIEAILSETPETRQTALFSATLPEPIHRLANRYMHEPQATSVSPQHLTVETIEQRYYLVHQRDKKAALNRLLEVETVESALIFARTRVGTAELAEALIARGHQAEAIHGDLSQRVRETVLRRFRQGSVKLLVATDVAARGLDIDDISHVINYDLPYDPEQYVHRIGRTGRAGKSGIAITLVTPKEQWRMRKIERLIKQRVPRQRLPTAEQVVSQRNTQFLDQLADQVAQGPFEEERALVASLAEAGCDPLDIAAAAIRLARAEEEQRPIEEIREVQEPSQRSSRHRKKRKSRRKSKHQKHGREPGMVRLSMSVGKDQGLRPGEVVGAIAGRSRIPGKAIGAIDIHAAHAHVDVAEQHVERVLHKMAGWKLRGHTIELRRVE